MGTFTVGQAARAAGVSARAVRLYEAKGLVPASRRTGNGYRVLTDEHVEALRFVRSGRSLGLSLDAIAEIMDVADRGEGCCDRTMAMLADRVQEIDTAIADLHRLRETIVAVQHAKVDQRGSTRCAVIESAPSAPTGPPGPPGG